MGVLQMDWLRSEDLKEEKNLTAPIAIIAVHAVFRFEEAAGVPLGMHRMSPEYSAFDPAYVAGNVLLREEPDEEEDDEEEHDGGGEDDDGDEGYSE
jgi:hypothetical protein